MPIINRGELAEAQHTDEELKNLIRNGRFRHVHIDFVSPLPRAQRYRYYLNIIDHFSRWSEAIPIQDTSTTTIAEKFFKE